MEWVAKNVAQYVQILDFSDTPDSNIFLRESDHYVSDSIKNENPSAEVLLRAVMRMSALKSLSIAAGTCDLDPCKLTRALLASGCQLDALGVPGPSHYYFKGLSAVLPNCRTLDLRGMDTNEVTILQVRHALATPLERLRYKCLRILRAFVQRSTQASTRVSTPVLSPFVLCMSQCMLKL